MRTSLSAPRRVLARDATDQFANLAVHLRAAGLPAGLPAPVQLEALPVPLDHGGRLHDDQGRPPVRPEARQPDPEDPVSRSELGALDGSLEYSQLMAQRQVLSGQSRPAEHEGPEESQDHPNHAHPCASVNHVQAHMLPRAARHCQNAKSLQNRREGVFGRGRSGRCRGPGTVRWSRHSAGKAEPGIAVAVRISDGASGSRRQEAIREIPHR